MKFAKMFGIYVRWASLLEHCHEFFTTFLFLLIFPFIFALLF